MRYKVPDDGYDTLTNRILQMNLYAENAGEEAYLTKLYDIFASGSTDHKMILRVGDLEYELSPNPPDKDDNA